MSEDGNLETYGRFSEALERGDLESAAAELGPRVEIDDRDILESTGQDSFYVWMGRWNAVWESWSTEETERLAVGDDKVLSLFRMTAKGKGSGIELSRDDAVLAEFEAGKIVRIGYYNDQALGHEAAGLPAG